MNKGYLTCAIVLFVLLILHWSPWTMFTGGKPLSALLVKDNWGHYLMLDRELWSCLLAGLSLLVASVLVLASAGAPLRRGLAHAWLHLMVHPAITRPRARRCDYLLTPARAARSCAPCARRMPCPACAVTCRSAARA